MSAPSSRSSKRFPSYSAGGSPLRASTARRPSRAHTAATQRQQLDCSVPHVISVSAFWASASPTRNSSLRILLPVSSSPVRSSRLTHSSTPSSAESRSSFRSGVGAYASSTRGIGGADVAMETTISGEEVAWQGLATGDGLAKHFPQHQRVAHGVIAVGVVERDGYLLGLAGGLVDLRHQLAQLGLGVEIIVFLAHGGLLAAQLAPPALGVAPVQAEDGPGRGHLRDARPGSRADPRVDADGPGPRAAHRSEG